jgi:hypothetical protein
MEKIYSFVQAKILWRNICSIVIFLLFYHSQAQIWIDFTLIRDITFLMFSNKFSTMLLPLCKMSQIFLLLFPETSLSFLEFLFLSHVTHISYLVSCLLFVWKALWTLKSVQNSTMAVWGTLRLQVRIFNVLKFAEILTPVANEKPSIRKVLMMTSLGINGVCHVFRKKKKGGKW